MTKVSDKDLKARFKYLGTLISGAVADYQLPSAGVTAEFHVVCTEISLRKKEAIEFALESSQASQLVLTERHEHITREGWTADHDDEHGAQQLLKAAICYAEETLKLNQSTSFRTYMINKGSVKPPADWPWDPEWWKFKDDPIRNLVKASALLIAEIDRLLRKR